MLVGTISDTFEYILIKTTSTTVERNTWDPCLTNDRIWIKRSDAGSNRLEQLS